MIVHLIHAMKSYEYEIWQYMPSLFLEGHPRVLPIEGPQENLGQDHPNSQTMLADNTHPGVP